MIGFRSALLRLLLFMLVVALGTTFTVRALQRPAAGDQIAYSALFTNASGLHSGDDVRLLGVQVGKVRSVSLQRGEDGRRSVATVDLTIRKDQPLRTGTRLAIRFQNLTGQRYIDVQRSPAAGPTVPRGTTLGLNQTVPSFDITTIFNGLQPVLATMSPQDIDHFAQSVAVMLTGDGSGLAPMLSAIDELSTFTDDRAVLFETLIHNFSDLAETIGGKSASMDTIIGYLSDMGAMMARSAPAYRVLSDQGARVMTATDALLASMNLTPDRNPWLDGLLDPEAKKLQPLVDLAALLPGVFALLTGQDIPAPTGDQRCSQGVATLPAQVQLFVRGMRVTLCNK